jgi:bifunctional DNA-binding transcriptional regulator/antitoxin component of YhaV-PrlF toxin-antitoxin module
MNYIVEVQEDDNGNPFITLPDELVDELGWQEGDVLDWGLRGNGVVLTKVNESAGYEVLED